MTEPAKKWEAYRPRRGDVIHLRGERYGIVERVDGAICYVAPDNGPEADCFIWAFREGLNAIHTWPAHDVRQAAA
ncbi:MAG: hypothetical protein ACLFV8_12680 [Alphaproteobacteria bacterium]